MNTQTEQLSAETPTPVATKIETSLNLSPKQVDLGFGFDNHVITPKIFDKLVKTDTNVLTGELDWEVTTGDVILNPALSAASVPKKTAIPRILPSLTEVTGTTEDQMVNHYKFVGEFLKKGKMVAAIDSDTSYLYQLAKDDAKSFYLTLVCGGLLSSGGLVQSVAIANEAANGLLDKNISRRELLNKAAAATVYAVVSGTSLNVVNSMRSDRVKYDQWEKILRGASQPEFVRFNEGLFTLRQKLMALNIWSLLSGTDKNSGEKVNIFSLAANGHKKLLDYFLQGPEQLEQEVTEYAQRLVNPTTNLLMEQDIPEDERTRKLVGYSELFQDVSLLGDNKYFDLEKITIPTSRDILLKGINRALEQNVNNPKKRRVLFDLRVELERRDRDRNQALSVFNQKIRVFDNG